MSVLNIILVVLLFLSGIATCILILMHSGKGTGVSELIASSMYNASAGSGIWEKNLDRLTVITSLIFIACVLFFVLCWTIRYIRQKREEQIMAELIHHYTKDLKPGESRTLEFL